MSATATDRQLRKVNDLITRRLLKGGMNNLPSGSWWFVRREGDHYRVKQDALRALTTVEMKELIHLLKRR